MNETKKDSGIPNRHSLPVSIPLRHFRQPRATLCPIDYTKPKSPEKIPISETTTDNKKDSEAVEKKSEVEKPRATLCPIDYTKPKSPEKIPISETTTDNKKDSEAVEKKSEVEKKIPKNMENAKQINSIAENRGELPPTKISKETNTDEWVASPERQKKYRFPIHQDLRSSLDTLLNYLEQKTLIYLSQGTQTDDVIILSSDEYAEYEEFKKSREDNSNKASVTDFLKGFAVFGQHFRQFFFDVSTTCHTLFKEHVGDDNRVYVCTNEKRLLFLNIIQEITKMMKMRDEVKKEEAKEESLMEDSNNKNEQTPIQDPVHQVDSRQEQMEIIADHQTSMAQNLMIETVGSDVLEPKEQEEQNDIHESENQYVPLQQNNVLYAQSNVNNNNLFNTHQNTRQFLQLPRPLFVQQQPQLLQQQPQLPQQQPQLPLQQPKLPLQQPQLPQQQPQLPLQQPQLPQQQPQLPLQQLQLPLQQPQQPLQQPQMPHKQSQLLQQQSQLPQQQPVNIQQQRVHPNSGIFYGHQNKIYRYPGTSNNRATPFYQKSQKKRIWQQQQHPIEPMMQTPPNQPQYYQANSQQLFQQQMHYQ